MGRVFVDKSVSLDGYVAGPHDEIEPLHDWLYDDDAAPHGQRLLAELLDRAGAVVMGRRTFDLVDGPEGWTAPDGTPFALPVVVLTSAAREPVTKGATRFSFAGDVAGALGAAREAAGDGDVSVMGARTARTYLGMGLVDELVLHYVPVVLGAGIPLFDGGRRVDLTPEAVLADPAVTHVRYAVSR
jgi:dihydrofolate reductase